MVECLEKLLRGETDVKVAVARPSQLFAFSSNEFADGGEFEEVVETVLSMDMVNTMVECLKHSAPKVMRR